MALQRLDQPAGGVLHPLFLVALTLLVLNDHAWKWSYPSAVTGKLSDVAGLIVTPMLLQAFFEVLARDCEPRRSNRALLGAILATGIAFTLIKTWGPAAQIYRYVFGALQWPYAALRAWPSHKFPPMLPVALVQDSTDLYALPTLGAGLVAGWKSPDSVKTDETC